MWKHVYFRPVCGRLYEIKMLLSRFTSCVCLGLAEEFEPKPAPSWITSKNKHSHAHVFTRLREFSSSVIQMDCFVVLNQYDLMHEKETKNNFKNGNVQSEYFLKLACFKFSLVLKTFLYGFYFDLWSTQL